MTHGPAPARPATQTSAVVRRRFVALAALAAIPLGGAVVLAPGASAATPAPTIWASRHTVLQQDPVTLYGKARQRTVTIYRSLDGKHWGRVRSVPAGKGRYHTVVHPAVGRLSYYRVGLHGHRTSVRSVACTPLRRHTGVQMWRNDRTQITTLPTKWIQLICSAAPHSTVRFSAMWIYDDTPVMGRMVAALRNVHRLRGVHVKLFVRRSSYSVTRRQPDRTWGLFTRLFSFASISSCLYSCSSSSASAHMHVKFLSVTKTIFGGPAVVETSANFSEQQLAGQRQSGIYVYDNPALVSAFTKQWDAMVAHKLVDLPTWYSVGGGIAVSFDPQSVATDPVAAELNGVTCQHGDSIEVANATVQRPRVVTALNALHAAGCDVRVIYEAPVPYTSGRIAKRQMVMHDKFIVIQAHQSSGRPLREVIAGSEDLMTPSLVISDQQLLRVGRTSIVNAYAQWFARLWWEAGRKA